jgi:hypothetical protein
MFGFYDPRSLAVKDRSASIDFINSMDASDVTSVQINTIDELRAVSSALKTQKERGIASLKGEIIEFRGSIVLLDRNEALLTPEGGTEDEIIPMEFGFDVTDCDLPEHGFAIGEGVKVDGAIVIYRLAVQPIGLRKTLKEAPIQEATNQPH